MLAQLSYTTSAAGVTTPSPALAGLLGALLWLSILGGVGGLLAHHAKWDDILRVIVVILGVTTILLSIPILGVLGQLLQRLITGLVGAMGASSSFTSGLTFVIGLAIAAVGVIAYYQKRGFGRALLMSIAISAFVGADWMQSMSAWFITHIGVNTWNYGCSAFDMLMSIQVHLG